MIRGEDATLTTNEDGSVLVSDPAGNAVNLLGTPWARDAEGRDLPTHYTVDGNVLTQHVDTTGAVFPVVADPTSECGLGWCSVYFNREETAGIAAGSATGAAALVAGCTSIDPIIGGACALGFGISAAVAQGAHGSGNCLGWFFSVGNNPFSSLGALCTVRSARHRRQEERMRLTPLTWRLFFIVAAVVAVVLTILTGFSVLPTYVGVGAFVVVVAAVVAAAMSMRKHRGAVDQQGR